MPQPPIPRQAIWYLAIAACSIVALLALSAVGVARYGSTNAAIEALQGRTIVVDSPHKHIGVCEEGESRTVDFLLQNVSDKTVRIVGGSSSCSCALLDGIPFEMQPGSRRVVHTQLRIPPQRGSYSVIVKLLTTVPEQSSIILEIRANVKKGSKRRGQLTSGGRDHTLPGAV